MAVDDKYLWQDNTRIKWEDIKLIWLPEYDGYLMEACEENHILSKNDFEYLFKKCFFKTVDYRDQTEVTAKYDKVYNVGYLQWTPDYMYTADEYTYRNYSSILLNPQNDYMYLYLPIPPELSYYSNQLILEAWSVDYEINGNYSGILEKSDIQNIDLVDQYGEVYPINTITSQDQDSQLRIKLYWHNVDSNIRFFVNYITFKINKAYDSHSIAVVSIKDNYNLVRFRAQESNTIYEYICQDELANMNGKLYLGDIVFAQFDKYLYNWSNSDWNPSLDLFFSTVSGNENTTTKTEIISYNSNIDLTEDSQTLISRMSKLQTIPKLLIDNKRIMKIRTINENKTQNDKDGFNVEGLEINGVKNNYRFGAYPNTYPDYICGFTDKDLVNNNVNIQIDSNKSIIKISEDSISYNPDQDQLVVYKQYIKNNSYSIENKLKPTFSSNKAIVVYKIDSGDGKVIELNDGLKLDAYYNSYLRDRPNSEIQIKYEIKCDVAEINENLIFTKDDIRTEKNSSWSFKNTNNSTYQSIITSEKKNVEVKLKNVGDWSKENNLTINIGPSSGTSATRLGSGIPIKINYTLPKLIINNDIQFSNEIRIQDGVRYASDVEAYCNSDYYNYGDIYDRHGYIKLVGTLKGLYPTSDFVDLIENNFDYLEDYHDWEGLGDAQWRWGDNFYVTQPTITDSEGVCFIRVNDLSSGGLGATYHLKIGLDVSQCWTILYELVLWRNVKLK